MTESWFNYVRRIKRNDYQGRKCAECSIKHRPKWADWSWLRIILTNIADEVSHAFVMSKARQTDVGYAESEALIDFLMDENRSASSLFDAGETCDHVFHANDPVVREVQDKLLAAARG